jgi:ABC-type nitrate/sulfonate/bicarbonate transport system substrate-binding protein
MRGSIYARWEWPGHYRERRCRTLNQDFTSLGPSTASTIRNLARLKPKVLATMHGSSFSGDGAAALSALGDHYDQLLRTALANNKLS